MHITQAQLRAGTIVLNESVPTVSVGRIVLATVLSAPMGGSVLVSMFGKKLLVETTLPLEKGQVFNLKVHAVSPKVILKPMPVETSQLASSLKDLGTVLAAVVGKGDKGLRSFLVQEVTRQLSSSGQDEQSAQVVSTIMDQMTQYPNAIAHLLIPLVDNDSRGAARVSIEKEEGAYVVNFDMETEHLGSLACRARMGRGMDVEIRTPFEDTAEFLRANLFELREALQPFGARSVEVVRGAVRSSAVKEVNVLV
jgi:hypothetical protein